MVNAVVFIANGTEEMEFTITYDTLVRAGVKTTSVFVPASDASSASITATCSRGVKIIADTSLIELGEPSDTDLLVVPGGAKGAETISQNIMVQGMLLKQYEAKKLVGMICAGSLAAKTSAFPREAITSHPSVRGELEGGFEYLEDAVVVSDNLVTSRGPGTAFPFALKLVEILMGSEKRAEVQGPMVFPAGAI